jgi:UDP-N-acetylmuramate dehydrogenase
MDSELGHISQLVEQAVPEASPLEKRLARLSGQLVWVTLILTALKKRREDRFDDADSFMAAIDDLVGPRRGRRTRVAADAGISGLSFYRGIPGCVGGALRMNGGAHGSETREVVVSVRAVDRNGDVHVLPVVELHYEYRHCGVPDDFIFTEALFQGVPGEPPKILTEMDDIAAYREQAQPIKSRTGGSTFKNPPGGKAWQLIDAAGCRGLVVGGAQVSELHCNFLINLGTATAADIETPGETVRKRVKESSGVDLEWEIKRIGVPA